LAKKRIGILTGGGDVSGLNSVLKTVTYRGSDNGIDIIGLRRGWEASLTSIATIRPAGAAISCHWIVRTRAPSIGGRNRAAASRTNPSNKA